jgi:hypothetical protein
MHRRDVLKSTAAVLTAGAAGLAGCSGGSDSEADPTPDPIGDAPACQPPSGAPADALPTAPSFEQRGDVTASDASHDDGVERTAYALYRGPDDGTYYCSISEYTSAATADEGTERVRLEGGNSNAVLGLVQFDRWVFFGAGPDREQVRRLLGATTLSEACLDDAFRSLSGTATPEPL